MMGISVKQKTDLAQEKAINSLFMGFFG